MTALPLVTSVGSDGNSNSNYSYDNEFDVTEVNGAGTGLCTSSVNTTYDYGYDAAGRTTRISTGFNYGGNCGAPATVPAPQTYVYVPGSNYLQTYSGPDGAKTFTYDGRGLVTGLTVKLPDGASETWSFDYDAAGRSWHVTYPDGHQRTQLYDGEGRITSRCYSYGGPQYCYTAQYDAAGNPKALSDPYGSDASGGVESYQYDALNRLTQLSRALGGAPEHVESYTYNAIGALHTSFDPVAMAAVTFDDQRPRLSGSGSADAAIANTFGGSPVTLDGGGRITAFAGATFGYTATGRVLSAQFTSNGHTITESYHDDAYFRRSGRRHNDQTAGTSSTTLYVYDGPHLVATVDGGGSLQDAYLFDAIDHPLRLRRNRSSYFYEVDLAGNVRRLRDASGADLGGYRYTAFGQTFRADAETAAAAIDQPLRWKGRWFEPAAGGLYEMRARWWSPQLGAFLAIDGYAHHDTTSTLWGWGHQNPIAYSDPSGRDAIYVAWTGPDVTGYPYGHAGLILVDPSTGNTAYTDFYPGPGADPTGLSTGVVHYDSLGQVALDENGQLSQSGLVSLILQVSADHANGRAIEATYLPDVDFDIANAYAVGSAASPPTYNVLANNCANYAESLIRHGLADSGNGFLADPLGLVSPVATPASLSWELRNNPFVATHTLPFFYSGPFDRAF